MTSPLVEPSAALELGMGTLGWILLFLNQFKMFLQPKKKPAFVQQQVHLAKGHLSYFLAKAIGIGWKWEILSLTVTGWVTHERHNGFHSKVPYGCL